MIEQNTPEWFRERNGKATSSAITPIMAVKGLGAGAKTYALEIVGEKMSEEPDDELSLEQLDFGHENEPIAVEKYELRTFRKTETCGFIVCPDAVNFGGSPDRLVDEDGLLEVKCRMKKSEHAWVLVKKVIPPKHMDQVQGNLLATGRKWCDFISYCPKFTAPYDLCVIRVQRDEEYISLIRYRLKQFNELVEEYFEKAREQVKL